MYKGEIIEIKQESINAKVFKIKVENFNYLPGQFIKIHFNKEDVIKYAKERLERKEINEEIFKRICERANKTFREYSITNPPGDNYIEILVGRNNEGGFSPFFCDNAKVGDSVIFTGPFGKFVIDENDKNILFLAGGTGIAPFICHLRYLNKTQKINEGKYVLIYSNRTFQHICYKKELESIPNLKVYHTLTRLTEEEKKNWKGYSRAIDAEMIKEVLMENNMMSDETRFYICGSVEFVCSMISIIKSLGFKRENIKI
ncbi:MAG: FAD-binding oxidoreductase, partial [Candidatus Aenigmarchaeota archaeon]|nr:FAD-binding oxidoreductase [Candidatus Aenigmarchaeota archaeon]MDW8149100.1 FAD-binding oxidoreductase [Candidatus Aenigmarchaeota archaeon]